MSTPALTFQSSDLSRNPLKVFSAAEESPVVLTRRDGEPLVLMNEREAKEQQLAFELAAQLIAVVTKEDGSLVDRMAEQFPWMLALSDSERVECANDVIRASRAAFSMHKPALLLFEIQSWRETATAIAEGLTVFNGEWFTESRPVSRPVVN